MERWWGVLLGALLIAAVGVAAYLHNTATRGQPPPHAPDEAPEASPALERASLYESEAWNPTPGVRISLADVVGTYARSLDDLDLDAGAESLEAQLTSGLGKVTSEWTEEEREKVAAALAVLVSKLRDSASAVTEDPSWGRLGLTIELRGDGTFEAGDGSGTKGSSQRGAGTWALEGDVITLTWTEERDEPRRKTPRMRKLRWRDHCLSWTASFDEIPSFLWLTKR